MTITIVIQTKENNLANVYYKGVKGRLPQEIDAHKVKEGSLRDIPLSKVNKWIQQLRERDENIIIRNETLAPPPEESLEEQEKQPLEKDAKKQFKRQEKSQEVQVELAEESAEGARAETRSELPTRSEKPLPGAPEKWQRELLVLMRARRPVIAVVGPPGVGKTYTVELIAREVLGCELLIVDGNAQMLPSDFAGRYTFVQDEAGAREVWKEGFLEQAQRENKLLLVNEADALPPETLTAIVQSIAANPLEPSYALSGDGRKIDFSHYPFTPIVFTMNTSGQGEATGFIRFRQDHAILDRLTFVQATQPPPDFVLGRIVYQGEKLIATFPFIVRGVASMTQKIRQALEDWGALITLTDRDIARVAHRAVMYAKGDFNKRIDTNNIVKEAFRAEWVVRYPPEERDALEKLLEM